MKYRLLLTNVTNGDEAETIIPARAPLEDLSAKIKVELQLPLSDGGWHRFLTQGTAYMPRMTCGAEEEIRWECGCFVGRYRYSEDITIRHAFTTLGSVVTYTQDRSCQTIKVRCTLIERI